MFRDRQSNKDRHELVLGYVVRRKSSNCDGLLFPKFTAFLNWHQKWNPYSAEFYSFGIGYEARTWSCMNGDGVDKDVLVAMSNELDTVAMGTALLYSALASKGTLVNIH